MGTEMYCFRSIKTAGSRARAWIWAKSASRCTQSTTLPACSSCGLRRARSSATNSDRVGECGRDFSAESDLVRSRSSASPDGAWITSKPEVIRWSLGISGTYRAPDGAEGAEERDAGWNRLVARRANILVRLQRSHKSHIVYGLAWGVAPDRRASIARKG